MSEWKRGELEDYLESKGAFDETAGDLIGAMADQEMHFERERSIAHLIATLHKKGRSENCSHCSDLAKSGVPWPCLTLRTLEVRT